MFCRNCGKQLRSDDKFCSECGTKVERDEAPKTEVKPEPKVEFKPEPRQSSMDQMPSFVSDDASFFKSTLTAPEESPRKLSERRPVERETFDWNLEGYPTSKKRTDDINFDWKSVMEENYSSIYPTETSKEEKTEVKEELISEPVSEVLEEVKKVEVPETAEEPKEAEVEIPKKTLEEELFSDMSRSRDTEGSTKFVDREENGEESVDKFYTFNRKKTEFQALLDQEYEKIRVLNDTLVNIPNDISEPVHEFNFAEEPPQKSETAEKLEELEDENALTVENILAVAGEDEEIASDEVAELEVNAETEPETEYVGVLFASTPKGYVHLEEENKEENIEENKVEECPSKCEEEVEPEEEPEEQAETAEESGEAEQTKGKLTFGDVFGADDDENDERTEKEKGGCLRVIAVILCILVVIELAMIGIQHFAPDSTPSQMITKGYNSVINLITQNDSNGQGTDTALTPADDVSDIQKAIDKNASLNLNIAEIKEDATLYFENGSSYGFNKLADASTFENEPWYTDEDDNTVTYFDAVVGSIIKYTSEWVDKMNEGKDDILSTIEPGTELYRNTLELKGETGVSYGIESLAIGEIKSNGSGFYVMTSVAKKSTKDTELETENAVFYIEPDNKAMMIQEVSIVK